MGGQDLVKKLFPFAAELVGVRDVRWAEQLPTSELRIRSVARVVLGNAGRAEASASRSGRLAAGARSDACDGWFVASAQKTSDDFPGICSLAKAVVKRKEKPRSVRLMNWTRFVWFPAPLFVDRWFEICTVNFVDFFV